MHTRRSNKTTLAALSILLLISSLAPAQPKTRSAAPPEISYKVSMPRPFTHLLEVEMRVRRAANAPAQLDIVMPVWTPGSYLIREYERHVQDFEASDAQGRALVWDKTNKNTWRIETGGAGEILAKYRVYANELTVRTNEVNDQHAFWNNAALLMYPDGELLAPSTLEVVPYGNWKIATGLPEVSGRRNTFRAENFDILYDSPFEVSNFKTISFEVRGVPHRIVIDGEGNYDAERMRQDVQKIVETEAAMMGDIPYHDYTFILHLRSTGGGGLEHLNSTALGYPRSALKSEGGWRGFLGLVAHEFFHLWNVKRIRPDALGPFDYTKENYTKLLWVAEGITDYYASLLVRRAGFVTDREYLNNQAQAMQSLQSQPGRLQMSAEEASFNTWIKEYRPDENSINTSISYYPKGAALGLLLDLEIRKRSGGAKSLDDVMRYLYTDFYKRGRNYTPADFQRACELMTGSSLEDFFRRYVHGREELPYEEKLGYVGLHLETTRAGAPERPYLGANLNQDGERLMVRAVLAGTPAYDQGLNTGDQVIAFDGARVNQDQFNARVAEKKPGDTIRLTIFRSDDLRNLDIKLGGRLDPIYVISTVAQPTDEQKRLYQGWIGATQ
ncbi:MAG: PDZ domain-containing protein [Pyrinomonadaceae bacterium]